MTVSIVTLTLPGREQMLERCKRIVEGQTYAIHEHLIIGGAASVGMKRNEGINQATGDIIVMFDDDDLYAVDYVERCANILRDADVTGSDNAYFYQEPYVWEYKYGGSMPYVMGSGMAFHRSIAARFPDISRGEEIGFLKNAGKITPHGYKNGMLAIIHGKNTASHTALRIMQRSLNSEILTIFGSWLRK